MHHITFAAPYLIPEVAAPLHIRRLPRIHAPPKPSGSNQHSDCLTTIDLLLSAVHSTSSILEHLYIVLIDVLMHRLARVSAYRSVKLSGPQIRQCSRDMLPSAAFMWRHNIIASRRYPISTVNSNSQPCLLAQPPVPPHGMQYSATGHLLKLRHPE